MHPRSREDDFLNNLRPVPVVVQQEKVDRVGLFEPTTSAMYILLINHLVIIFTFVFLHMKIPRIIIQRYSVTAQMFDTGSENPI
jgi:hypothetical protein